MTQEQHENQNIKQLIACRLQTRALDEQPPRGADDHLDADTVAAFVEGRVAEPGAAAITSHLIVCSSCRRATATTVHLEDAVEGETEELAAEESPGRLRQFLDDLAARVFPSSEEVVFAYQEPSATQESTEGDDREARSSEAGKDTKE